MIEFGELPDSWIVTNLRNIVLSIQYGHTASATEKAIGPKFLRITDLQNNSVNWNTVPFCHCDETYKYELKKGDIVIARTGATTGKSFLLTEIPEPTIFASYLIRLSTSNIFPPEYIALFMQSIDYWRQITTISKGSAQPGANASILSELSIPFPPLNEQRRLLAKIEALKTRSQRVKDALSSIPALLDQFRQSVLAAAFRGDLTADWRQLNPDVEPADVLLEKIRVERCRKWEEAELAKMKASGKTPKDDKWKEKYKEPEIIDDLELPKLPGGWCWVSIESIGEVSGGLTKNSQRDNLPLKFPYLRVANVYANKLELDEIKTIGIKQDEFERVVLQKGDLLVVEGNGSIDQIGRVALWDGSISPCLHQNHLIKVRFNSWNIGKYILWWLFSKNGRKQITMVASSTTGLHTLSISKVARLLIPIAPLHEQEKIVVEIESLFKIADTIKQQYQQSKDAINQLDQSILAEAFRGALVPQDPNDEPASVLLERIRAEREKSVDAKTKRSKKSQPVEESIQMKLELE